MLILTRKRDQGLVIDGEIRVTILKTQGDTVRLGIEAPPHVTVHRDEIHARILAEHAQQKAESSTGSAGKGAA